MASLGDFDAKQANLAERERYKKRQLGSSKTPRARWGDSDASHGEKLLSETPKRLPECLHDVLATKTVRRGACIHKTSKTTRSVTRAPNLRRLQVAMRPSLPV